MPPGGPLTAAKDLDRIAEGSAGRLAEVEHPHVEHCIDGLRNAMTALVETADAHEDPLLNTKAARVRRRLEDIRRARHYAVREIATQAAQECDGRLPVMDAVEALDRPEIECRVQDFPMPVAADPTVLASAARVIVESLTEAPTDSGSVELDRDEDGAVVLSGSIDADLPVAELSRLAGRLHRLIAPVTPSAESTGCRITMSGPEVHVALPSVHARTGAAGTVVNVQLRAA